MSVSQISPVAVRSNPAKLNNLVKGDPNATTVQANQTASKSVQASKTDTVTFSKEALQKLSDGAAAAANAAVGKESQPVPKKISVKA